MNTIKQLYVNYLRSSRTIEKILLTSPYKKSYCFVYNFEGYHFRLFESEMALDLFFKDKKEPNFSFSSEEDFDNFLLNYEYI